MFIKAKKFLMPYLLIGVAVISTLAIADDIVVTGSNVFASSTTTGRRVASGIAGQTVTAGQAVYTGTSGLVMLLSATTSNVIAGITLNAAAPGQPVSYVTFDPNFKPGATLNPGDVICVSATAAGNITLAPNVSGTANHGNYVTVIGVCTGTTSGTSTIYLQPISSGTPTP